MGVFNFPVEIIEFLSPFLCYNVIPLLESTLSVMNYTFTFENQFQNVSLPEGIVKYDNLVILVAKSIFHIQMFVIVKVSGFLVTIRSEAGEQNISSSASSSLSSILKRGSSLQSTAISFRFCMDGEPIIVTCKGTEKTSIGNSSQIDDGENETPSHLYSTPSKSSKNNGKGGKNNNRRSDRNDNLLPWRITAPDMHLMAGQLNTSLFNNFFRDFRMINRHVLGARCIPLNLPVAIKLATIDYAKVKESDKQQLLNLHLIISLIRNALKLLFITPGSTVPILWDYHAVKNGFPIHLNNNNNIIGFVYPVYRPLPRLHELKATPNRMVEIFYGVSSFLQDLHERFQMAHLDLHIANIMLSGGGEDDKTISRENIVVIDLETVTKFGSKIDYFLGCDLFSDDLFQGTATNVVYPGHDIICLSRLMMEISFGLYWSTLMENGPFDLSKHKENIDMKHFQFLQYLLPFAFSKSPKEIPVSMKDIIMKADEIFDAFFEE